MVNCSGILFASLPYEERFIYTHSLISDLIMWLPQWTVSRSDMHYFQEDFKNSYKVNYDLFSFYQNLVGAGKTPSA